MNLQHLFAGPLFTRDNCYKCGGNVPPDSHRCPRCHNLSRRRIGLLCGIIYDLAAAATAERRTQTHGEAQAIWAECEAKKMASLENLRKSAAQTRIEAEAEARARDEKERKIKALAARRGLDLADIEALAPEADPALVLYILENWSFLGADPIAAFGWPVDKIRQEIAANSARIEAERIAAQERYHAARAKAGLDKGGI